MHRVHRQRHARQPRPRKGYFAALDALHAVDERERLRQQLEHAVRVGDTELARKLTAEIASSSTRVTL